MERKHFLAAELFAYSFANYTGHLGVNDRFDKYMPEEVSMPDLAVLLQQAGATLGDYSEELRRDPEEPPSDVESTSF